MTKVQEYAMLYKREVLSEDYYIFLPCHLIHGEYDSSDKSITDLTGTPFYECNNYTVVTIPVELTYYYDITEDDLLNMYQSDDINSSVSKYYNELKRNVLIGKLDTKTKSLSIQSIPFNYINELLSNYNIDIKNKESKITISRTQLTNLLNQNDIVMVKKELGKLLDTSKFVEKLNEIKGVTSAHGNIGTKNLIVEQPRKTTQEEYEEIFSNLCDNSIDVYSDNRCRDTYEYILKYLVGQDDAVKKLISIMLNNIDAIKPKEIIKPLIIGQTGSGKTYFFELLSKYLNVPVITIDCNLLVQSGYEGQSLEDMLKELYIKCNKDIDKTEHAIVFLDEIDKLADKGAGVSDVGVQKSLLKFIEGHKYVIELDRLGREKIAIDTSMMNIAAGGAFENIVGAKEKKVGFMSDNNNQTTDKKIITPDDLVNFGMIRELIGRFGSFVQYNEVTKEMILKQLNKSLDSPIIINKEKFLRKYNVSLNFSEEFTDKIVSDAIKNKTGFRGLARIINEKLTELDFSIQFDKNYNKEIYISDNEEIQVKKIGTKK